MLLFAEIDLDLVAVARRAGQVLNHQHWNEQPGADLWPIPPVRALVLLSELGGWSVDAIRRGD